jgi:MFS family permease
LQKDTDKNLVAVNQFTVALYAATVCFLTYASVYAFRKPFTTATFEGMFFYGISYKAWLVISQAVGYTLSKFYGIRFIAGLQRFGRWKIIVLLIGIAWFALLLFATVPAPYNIVFLFINGFPLGIIWGIIFSYIEGRRATDFISAALAVSFIFSSGFVKAVAKFVMLHWHVSEFWVPFITGLIFVIPLLILLILIEKIPAPSVIDIEERKERRPMNKVERQQVITTYLPGLVTIILVYTFLTIFRDVRDNFAADIWKELGFSTDAAVFINTEIPVALVVLVIVALLVFVKNNFVAFAMSHLLMVIGFLISGISTYFFMQLQLSAFNWMLLVGIGLYMAYIPFNCILFERFFAAFRLNGNAGFFIYLADSFGYLGSILVLFGKEIFKINLNWVQFYSQSVFSLSLIGIAGTIISFIYFTGKFKKSVLTWSSVQPSL